MNHHLKASIRRLLPKQNHPHRIVSGPLRGMRIVTSWNDYPSAIMGYNERALLKWLQETVREGETWLDIGSHYGYTALAMGKLTGGSGRVFAFEPTLTTAGCVSRTMALNRLTRVTVIPLALGAPSTIEVRRLASTRGMSDSTLKSGGEEVTILVASFDWLWPQICGENGRIDGVKIDVQGMEIQVLRGMSMWLKTWKPKLALEVHEGVNRSELLDLIQECGYAKEARAIESVEGDRPGELLDNRSYAFSAQ